ncbi:MAG: glycosyltransferase [Bacteroidales bacterium]
MKKKTSRKKVLMAVYNDIQLDGRVQRAARALAYDFDLLLCSVNSSSDYTDVPCRNANFKLGRFAYIRFLFKLLFLFLKERPDILYIHDYNMVAFIPMVLPFLGKSKLVYDAHETIAVNKRSEVVKIVRYFACIEKRYIKHVDLVITPIEDRASFMRRFYGLKDIHIFKNIPIYSFTQLPEKKIEEKVKIIYQGILNKNRKLDSLIFLAEELGNQFQFDFVGYGTDEDRLKKMVSDRKLTNVKFLGKVSPQNLHKYLLHADIGLAFYPMDSINTRFCAPNKIYEYAQAGLIIVSSNQWLFRDTFKKYPFGVAVDIIHDPISKLADEIREIAKIRGKSLKYSQAFLSENNAEKEMNALKDRIFEL